MPPLIVRRLDAVELPGRPGGGPGARRARRSLRRGADRPGAAILRALSGDATQREIGAALYLSINTVKGYTKILYRKLGVATRQDAVREARALGLI